MTWMYAAGRFGFRLLYFPLGLTVRHPERMPAEGPVLLACNHASYADPTVVGAALERPIHFMARQSLFDTPGFGWLIRQVHAFPVDREGDPREAIRAVGERLAEGKVVLVFPEGTRTADGRIGEVKGGVGMMAVRYGAPVLPAYVQGTYAMWPRHRILPHPARLTLHLGPLVEVGAVGDRAARRKAQERIATETETRLRALEVEALRTENGQAEHADALEAESSAETTR